LPKLMDKSGFDKQVEDVRFQLEKQSIDCVNYEIKVDDAKSLVDHITQRLKFFQTEADIQHQKINALENRLAEISGERNHLLRSAKIAEDDIARDQNQILKSEQELENLRKQLSNNRLLNKKIEFEIQTLQDELAFRKAVFNDESTELRTQSSKGINVIPAVDLSNFYKNELAIAVRQIRDDFQRLNAQQMQDYKQVKESELSIFTQQVEYERVQAQKAKAKMDANMEAESMSSVEISRSMESNKTEMNHLGSQYGDLKNRLSTLEEHLAEIKLRNANTLEKQNNEIMRLKEQNNSFANELEYWERG
jgi:chromosome segregation ATPase